VVHRAMYGCTHSLIHNWLPRLNVAATEIDLTDPDALPAAVRPETRVVYFETPTNPTLEVIDMAAVAAHVAALNARRAPEEHIYVVVDNTFATPYCQRPLAHGADFVVHSLTKGISGFGTDMGGVVIGPQSHHDAFLLYRKDFGAVLSPRAAWSIMTYGLPSLAVRLHRAQASALDVARYLAEHPAVARVVYPGLDEDAGFVVAQRQMRDYQGRFAPGIMIYFELQGTTPEAQQEAGAQFINHLAEHAYTITLAVSLGNVRTLVEHPSSMTHAPIPLDAQAEMGIHPGGLRLSIGLEDPADLQRDLDAALAVAEPAFVGSMESGWWAVGDGL